MKSASKENHAPQAKDRYPLDVCVVSGEPLGSMGDPYMS